MRRLFALVNLEKSQEIAAAKAGMDRKTARKYLRAARLPSELPQVTRSRRRVDPFEEVWGELRELLQVNPGVGSQDIVRIFYNGSTAFRMGSYARCGVG